MKLLNYSSNLAIKRKYMQNIFVALFYKQNKFYHSSRNLLNINSTRYLPVPVLQNSQTNASRKSRSFHSAVHLNAQKCELTSKRYPVKRGDYNQVENSDIQFFKHLLDDHRVITDESELDGYNIDWIGFVRGASSIVVKPQTTDEVSKILKYCNDKVLAVCPQGGNTGLVGGSVPVFDEIVVSTSLMNKVEKIDPLSGVAVVQAGVVHDALNEKLAEFDLMLPLDLGSKGSCQIGGNVSTNAGGLRLIRYGSLHGTVLGVEAVLPSGEIVDCLSSLKKDNTGYDLKQLFIGSEGTLGMVTKVSIACPIRPSAINLAFLGMSSFESILKIYQEAKVKLGEIMSSCELIDQASMDSVTTNLKLTPPIGEHPFYMLIETSGSNMTHDEEKLNTFLEDIMSSGLVADGTVVNEPSRMRTIWGLRERIAESLLLDGYCHKYDVSLPLPVFYSVVEKMRERLGKDVVRVTGYGHVGDGNLHFNVTTKAFNQEVLDKIEPHFFEIVSSHRGSISAEHGMGFQKKNFMHYSRDQSAIKLMKQLKSLLDPKGILNPYKVLPEN